MYIAVALEAWGVLKAPRSFSPVTVLGCYWKADSGCEGGQDREIAHSGKWDMTTMLSVTTPPIVWPKKRASAASEAIIKKQEWSLHIKQHNIACRPTCEGKSRRRERGAGVGRSGPEGRKKRAEKKKGTKRSCRTEITVKHKCCFVFLKRRHLLGSKVLFSLQKSPDATSRPTSVLFRSGSLWLGGLFFLNTVNSRA